MNATLAARIAQAPIVLIGVTMVVFFVLRVLPGDLVDAVTEGTVVTPEKRAEIEREFGLDDPLPLQYVHWLADALQGEFGRSVRFQSSVASDIRTRLPRTLVLAMGALVVSTLVGVASGVASAVKRNSPLDYAFRVISLAGLAMPLFFFQGLVRNYLLPKYTGWLPPAGYEDLWNDPVTNLQQVWLPAVLLGLALAAYTSRLTRSVMLDVLTEDYIRTARSKGLRNLIVVTRHALRNALLPVLTLASVQLGALLGGVVITESIFGIPGMGSYLIAGIQARDYSIVQACVLVSACGYILVNLLVDVLATRIDPRLRTV